MKIENEQDKTEIKKTDTPVPAPVSPPARSPETLVVGAAVGKSATAAKPADKKPEAAKNEKPEAKPAAKNEKPEAKKATKAATELDALGAKNREDAEKLGFEYEFLPYVPDYAKAPDGALAEIVKISPKTIQTSRVDARDQPAHVDDAFVASIKQKMLQPPAITWAKNIKTGKECWITVVGRRRVAAAVKGEVKEINAVPMIITGGLREYLEHAGKENVQREDMSAWDTYMYFEKLITLGMKATEIAAMFGEKTDGYVSHYRAIGKLDQRVQKLIRAGVDEPFKSHAITTVRHLKRVTDADVQTQMACDAVASEMAPKDVETMVQNWLDKQTKAAAGGDEKPKSGRKPIKLPEEIAADAVVFTTKKEFLDGFTTAYNEATKKLARLKASDKTKPETLAHQKGYIEALVHVGGLKT